MSERQPVPGELLLEIFERVTAEHGDLLGALGVSTAHLAAVYMRRCAALVGLMDEPNRSIMVGRVQAEFAAAVAREAQRRGQ